MDHPGCALQGGGGWHSARFDVAVESNPTSRKPRQIYALTPFALDQLRPQPNSLIPCPLPHTGAGSNKPKFEAASMRNSQELLRPKAATFAIAHSFAENKIYRCRMKRIFIFIGFHLGPNRPLSIERNIGSLMISRCGRIFCLEFRPEYLVATLDSYGRIRGRPSQAARVINKLQSYWRSVDVGPSNSCSTAS
jgi:hypothetical protein